MRAFYQLLANTLVVGITNFTVWFAIVFYIYLQTQSVLATSTMSGIFLLTTAVTSLWFGSLVDRYKKKGLMIFSSVCSLVIYIICFGIYALAPQGTFSDISNPVLWVFVVLILMGVLVGNIRNIALPVLVTLMIPEDRRDKANGLVGTVSGIGFLVTSVISGFLVGWAGMHWVLILAIVLTAVAIIHLWFLDIKEKKLEASHDHNTHKIDIKGTIAAIKAVPGLFALILFTTINNFLGGVFMSLMDAYGLSLVSVQAWGLIWGFLSTGFIVGGLIIAKKGLGKNPLASLFMANYIIWTVSIFFTIQPHILLLIIGCYIYLIVVPFIEAAEHTIVQKVVPPERQGRVFGFSQSIEQAASPLTAFAIGPITQFIFIPFMTTGAGVDLIGDWYGVGANRGMALVFSITGIIGLVITILARRTKYYGILSRQYLKK